MNWTVDEAKKALSKYEFIVVTPISMISDLWNNRITIKDALRIWTMEPTVGFHVGLRIVGTPEDIERSLKENEIKEETIKEVLKTLITVNNFQTDMKSLYEEEINNFNSKRQSNLILSLNNSGSKLYDIITKNPKHIEKYESIRDKDILKKLGKSKRKTKTLYERVKELADDEYLDVSNLKEDGTGAKKIKFKGIGKTKKIVNNELRIVSKDTEHYLLALKNLPGGERYIGKNINYE